MSGEVTDSWWRVQVKLKRERLELSSVYSSAIRHDDHTLGYIRLTSFSQKAAADVRRHLQQLEVRSRTQDLD